MLVSIRLYIPLCFYYITQTAARLHIPLPTLHSTMLLLYRGLPYNKDSRCQALHSTMLLLYQTQKSAQMMLWSPLHSTMLLLYPACHYLTPPALFAFTFHYASTISTPLLVYAPFPLYFTFHYASTISSCPFCWTAPICALHSTMLLLYPSIPPGIVEFFYHFTFHYASTISLSPADSPGWERAFTFHYASTISFCGKKCLFHLSNFTFHYASTISWLTYQNTMELLIFTFHYASTISYFTPPILLAGFTLHSTMLLLYHVSSSPRNHLELTLHSTMLLLYHISAN